MAGIYTDLNTSETYISAAPTAESNEWVALHVQGGSASGPGLYLVLTLREAIKVQTELGQAVARAQRLAPRERDGSPADF